MVVVPVDPDLVHVMLSLDKPKLGTVLWKVNFLPTTPIFSPGLMRNDRLFRTTSVLGLYRRTTF